MDYKITNERFGIFPCGWWDEAKQVASPNQRPQQTQTIGWVYEYITSERARKATFGLRAMPDTATREERSAFKVLNFEYATFSGIFPYRKASYIKERTPFLTIDIDHLESYEAAREVRQMFCQDTMVETALCFISPSGNGVKWVLMLPEWVEDLPFKKQFDSMADYVGFTYGLKVDKSGSDVCRACFLPYDPECYVNDKYHVKLLNY